MLQNVHSVLETHFWNYRQRNASSVLDEVEYLYNKGTRLIWFVDSLVNGNLKELKDFAKGVIERGLDIKWIGYARCDKRMDYEYLKLLKDSGCFGLKFGAESASNKVLDDMKKRVTNVEMEENFIDCKKLGIRVITTWIQAFPTETSNNFLETLTFINNTQKTIHRITSTPGYQLTAKKQLLDKTLKDLVYLILHLIKIGLKMILVLENHIF